MCVLLACSGEASPGESSEAPEEQPAPLPVYSGEIWCEFRPVMPDPHGHCAETREDCEQVVGSSDAHPCRSREDGWALTTETSSDGRSPFVYTHIFASRRQCDSYVEHSSSTREVVGAAVETLRSTGCYAVSNPSHVEEPLTPEQAFWMAAAHGADPMAIGNTEGPVEIVSPQVTRRYSTTELRVRFRNTDERTIDGIRFGAFCYDNFNSPVMNQYSRVRGDTNYTPLSTQGTIRPGATSRGSTHWRLSGSDLCTKVIIVVTEVHFTNNEVWEGHMVQAHDPREAAE